MSLNHKFNESKKQELHAIMSAAGMATACIDTDENYKAPIRKPAPQSARSGM